MFEASSQRDHSQLFKNFRYVNNNMTQVTQYFFLLCLLSLFVRTLKISELAAMGYKKLVGQTGKAILKTLQHLKLVHVSKEGEISLICFSQ
jgi:hypothetical protein